MLENLGKCNFKSTLSKSVYSFIKDSDEEFELAGPREFLYFNPNKTRAAIVTCGGLCPGLNDVIRAIFLKLYYIYGCKDVLGIRYGYSGLVEENGFEPIKLDLDMVENIHNYAGTILGSSRGMSEVTKILDYIIKRKINILFCVGGDGTLKGAKAINEEAKKRKYKLSVIGIPKTIDNDISYTDKSFGFDTAVDKATESILSAHVEAKGYYNGVGIVKLMGRHSGFIACKTSLAVSDANFVLIPEVDFDIEGKNGFLVHLFKRLKLRHHALIVIAEGAGQKHFKSLGKDISGNKRLGDIGVLIKDKIASYAKDINFEVSLKYIDPSYLIRSTPAIASDSIYCIQLAQNAIHAAMSGKSNIMIGYLNGKFVHVPISKAISKRKQVDSVLWHEILSITGQAEKMTNS